MLFTRICLVVALAALGLLAVEAFIKFVLMFVQ